MKKKQTFAQFLFNRRNHGRWAWWEAILIHGFGLTALIVGATSGVWYFSVPFFLLFEGVIFYGHWRNFTGKTA